MLARSTKSQRDGTESLSRQDETRVLQTAVLTPHDAPHGLDETNGPDEQDDMHEVDVTAADALLNDDSSDEVTSIKLIQSQMRSQPTISTTTAPLLLRTRAHSTTTLAT